ncbi:MAG TPA: LysR family transcriptional regulator [Acetobacteraceae bacterium]|nr:LysR family transcriptional regulator [Acetobacteraceae bacterium]
MELHEIRYFLALSRVLNFTRAAEQCHVSQPALTRAIQKMEAELGGLLFSRERTSTHLTDLGRLLLPHLEEVMSRTEAARDSAHRFLRLENAQLAVGVMCTVGPTRFVGFLNAFRNSHPGVEITLLEAVPRRLIELLSQGEIDVAIMARPDGFDDRFATIPLYNERFMVACPLGHKFAAQPAVEMRQMDGQIYLQRINCEFAEYLAAQCRESGAALVRSYRSEREDWIMTMVAAGMGVCFLPEYSAVVPGLAARPVIAPEVVRQISLVSVPGRRWSSPLARFVQAIRTHPWPALPPAAASRGIDDNVAA